MTAQTDVYELCSLDEYDVEQARIRSSLSWIIAKAHPHGAPEALQSFFTIDQDGVWYVRPALIEALVSCELYNSACNTLFGTPDRRFRDFDTVLNYLRDCGIATQYGEGLELSSEALCANGIGADDSAFDLYAHMTLCDCLMQAYANDLVKLDFILETVTKYASSGAEQPPVATSFDEALVQWLNCVCAQCDMELEKQAQQNPKFRYEVPQLTNVNEDLADGRALNLALFFYSPSGCLSLDNLALQNAPSLADSVHNLVTFTRTYETVLNQLTSSKRDSSRKSKGDSDASSKRSVAAPNSDAESTASSWSSVLSTLSTAQVELLRTFRCYLTVEDLLYSVRSVELNAIVFLLEVFYMSEMVLNGSSPSCTIAPVMSTSFVPALETVVEDDELNEEAAEPASEPNADLSRSPEPSVAAEKARTPEPTVAVEKVAIAEAGASEHTDAPQSPREATPSSRISKPAATVPDGERRPEPESLPLPDQTDSQTHITPAPTLPTAEPASASTTNGTGEQPPSGPGPSRITFGMLKRKPPTPLVGHNTAQPDRTATTLPSAVTAASPAATALNPPTTVSSAAPAPTTTTTTVTATATLTPTPTPTPTLVTTATTTTTATATATITTSNATTGRSLKEQFLINKMAKREQPADASPKSTATPNSATMQTTTWANIKRRSQTDLELVGPSSAPASGPTAVASDAMTQSATAAIPSQTTASANEQSAAPASDLTALHLRLEQKKRVIEMERARVFEDLTRQRQVASNQAYAQILNQRRARPDSSANPLNAVPGNVASPSSGLASQRDRLRTASLANLSTATGQLVQPGSSRDNQHSYLDNELIQMQNELDRFNQLRKSSQTNASPSTASARAQPGPSLPSGVHLGPVSTSNEAATAFQHRSMAPSPVKVGNDHFESRLANFHFDTAGSGGSFSFRSAANGGRSASMFFLNDPVNIGPVQPPQPVQKPVNVQLHPAPPQTQQPAANSTLLQRDVTESQKSDASLSSRPRGPPRRTPVRPQSQLVGNDAKNALQQMLTDASPNASLGDVPSSQPTRRSVAKPTGANSKSQERQPPSVDRSPAPGVRNDVYSAASTARSDFAAAFAVRTEPANNGAANGVTQPEKRNNAPRPNERNANGINVDSASERSTTNPVGFVTLGDGTQVLNVNELEERRRRLIETSQRRAAESAARREREAESAAREQERLQADEERRKQVEKARRDAIRALPERKQSESTAPPHSVANYSSAQTTPSSSSRMPGSKPSNQPPPAPDTNVLKRNNSIRQRSARDERSKSAFITAAEAEAINSDAAPQPAPNSNPRPVANVASLSRVAPVNRSFRAAGAAPPTNGTTQYVLTNSNVNLHAASNADLDAQTRLYVKPKTKSNRTVIMNAVAYACLAGSVNEAQKKAVIEEIERSSGAHFVILFRDAGSSQFKGVYEFDEERDILVRLTGYGPRQLTSTHVEKFFKFNSGTKSFTEVTSTRHVSTVIDAVTLYERYWQGLRKPTGSTSNVAADGNSSANTVSAQLAAAGMSQSIGPLSAANTERVTLPSAPQPSVSGRSGTSTATVRRSSTLGAPAVHAGMRPVRK